MAHKEGAPQTSSPGAPLGPPASPAAQPQAHAKGNLYAATSVGVEVFKPDGTRVGAITVPMQPANIAFGGADRRTLYVTARTGLYSTRVNVPGPP